VWSAASSTDSAPTNSASATTSITSSREAGCRVRSPSRLLGTAVRIALTIVVVIAAVWLLGLAALSATLNESILFLPRLFAAAILILAGIVLSELARTRIDALADRLSLAAPLGRIAQILVFSVFLVTALSSCTSRPVSSLSSSPSCWTAARSPSRSPSA
jgi:hypothetical protein